MRYFYTLLAMTTIAAHLAVISVVAMGIGATITGQFFRLGRLFKTAYLTLVGVIVTFDLGFGFCPLTLLEKYSWNLSVHRAYDGSFFGQYFPLISDFVDGNAVKIMVSVTILQLILWMVRRGGLRRTTASDAPRYHHASASR
jgi:hypothetical protein